MADEIGYFFFQEFKLFFEYWTLLEIIEKKIPKGDVNFFVGFEPSSPRNLNDFHQSRLDTFFGI